MNDLLLMAKMKEHADTRETLAQVLGIHPHTLYMKIRSEQGKRQDFTQDEIKKIAQRYDLSPQEVVKIFFD